MDQNDPNIERTEHGDIQQDIRKIFIGNDAAINAENESFLTKLRDVTENAPEVGEFHVRRLL